MAAQCLTGIGVPILLTGALISDPQVQQLTSLYNHMGRSCQTGHGEIEDLLRFRDSLI